MKQELQQQLFEKYQAMFVEKDLPMTQTCMCWGIEAGDGWFKLLDTLCYALQQRMANFPNMEPIIVEQVKEKYGGLRFSVRGGDDYTDGLISMAESMSYQICETCGEPGSPNKGGWISVRCDKCRK